MRQLRENEEVSFVSLCKISFLDRSCIISSNKSDLCSIVSVHENWKWFLNKKLEKCSDLIFRPKLIPSRTLNKNDGSRNHMCVSEETKIITFFNVKVYSKIRFYQSWRRQWPYKNYETQYINHNINHCKTHIVFWLLKSHFNARCVSPNHNNACSASVHIKMVRLWHDWCPSDIL